MDSILDWYRKEGVIFKGGSGSGVNLSKIRSAKEQFAGGGTASGPVSFMKAADASAGVIKSGGKTRRAAKMVVLDVDPSRHRRFHQMQSRGREKSLGADRGRLRFQLGRSGLWQRVFPKRQQLGAGDRRVHAGGTGRPRVADQICHQRPSLRDFQGPRPDENDRREHLFLRRSRHAVRYHDQRLAYLLQYRAHQRLQSLLRVHASGQLGV